MSFARFRPRFTVRWLIVAVAVVALLLGAYDHITMLLLANKYRRTSEYCSWMEQNCREIDRMDPEIRTRKSIENPNNDYFFDPDWNREMIRWFETMKQNYFEAAAHPRRPLIPAPPRPGLDRHGGY
jgi:hypothetical protein